MLMGKAAWWASSWFIWAVAWFSLLNPFEPQTTTLLSPPRIQRKTPHGAPVVAMEFSEARAQLNPPFRS